MSEIFSRETIYKGEPCVEISAGGYYALIIPAMGSNVIRLRDTVRKIDVFRFSEELSIETYKASPEVYGFPTLYFPNRLDNGVIATSDGVYRFPINEMPPYSNYMHGFLHKRVHKIKSLATDGEKAVAVFEYHYDDKDEMFKYFPLEFVLEIKYVLSENGLEQFYSLSNLSDKKLPVGIGSHTAIKAPFADGGDVRNIRLYAPVGDKILLDNRCLTTGEFKEQNDYDKQYPDGAINPATSVIDNDMYFALMGKLDGKDFHGVVAEDVKTGKKVCYETGEEYGFWIFWNEWGNKGYFCPEPMTWMINAPNLTVPKAKSGYREISKNETFTAYQHFFTKG